MARTIGSFLGLSKRTEMLLMTVLSLCVNFFDMMTLFEIRNHLDQVWNVPFDVTKFSPMAQKMVKMLLSGVVFVRTCSVHLYIALVVAVWWPCCFGTKPTLMLPWLTVSAVKNIGAGLVTFITGVYTCSLYGISRPACLKFVGAQIMDLGPSFYMWIVGLSLYRDLVKPQPIDKAALKLAEEEELNVALRRRKVKSMVDEDILRKQFESRRFIGNSAVEVKDIFIPSNFAVTLSTKFSRSLDSLLDMMTAKAEILDGEDFDIDEPIEDSLNISEKTAKLLGITPSEISLIKQNKQIDPEFPAYPVKPQKKHRNITNLLIPKKNSPVFLLTKTSMYTRSRKPVRPTKSELKTPKEFLKLKSPSDFMSVLPENEMTSSNYFENVPSFVTESFPTAVVYSFDQNKKKFDEKETFSSKYEMFDLKTNPEEVIQHKITSLSSNEKKKSSEEVLNKTDYSSEPVAKIPQLRYISQKVSHEIGCQVSTLSKRILNASSKEISEQFSKLSKDRKSRTITIKPPVVKRPVSTDSKKSCNSSPRENSYLGMYLNKMGTNENNFGVDKFGMVGNDKFHDNSRDMRFS